MSNIQLKNISKSFDNHIVLNNFSAQIPENKITCIMGPSGGGKTTLLRILANLDTKYTGEILNKPNDISFVFQENRLIPWLTGYENMLFSIENKAYFDDVKNDIDTLINTVGLKKHINKMPDELSGGMQRRISLLRAFIYPAELLLMDEAFTGLDKKTKLSIANSLLKYAINKNRTIVMVSHDENIINLADNIITLKHLAE